MKDDDAVLFENVMYSSLSTTKKLEYIRIYIYVRLTEKGFVFIVVATHQIDPTASLVAVSVDVVIVAICFINPLRAR